MGTPEFPNLGNHCMVEDCKQIDFLPFTCDRCNRVFCLEHRSFGKHRCPNANKEDVTVVICPLCAKGIRLNPEEDPNLTWELHVNTECDPSNYDKVTQKSKCPVTGCREVLTFSNTIKCRDCTVYHCLKHRFGPDHKCPGPKKPESAFSLMSSLSRSGSKNPSSRKSSQASAGSSKWSASLLSAASSFRASTEAGLARVGNEFTRALQIAKDGAGPSGSSGSGAGQEACPQCSARFAAVAALVEHVQKVHENSGNQNGVRMVNMDVCPKCSKGFRDPVALVEHFERDHRGTSRA